MRGLKANTESGGFDFTPRSKRKMSYGKMNFSLVTS